MIVINIFTFIVACLILARSGAWVVQSLTRIARLLGCREFLLASLLMAFITSLPELFVSVSSSLHQAPQLSFGNIIGSNIIALALVMGLGAVIARGLSFKSKAIQKSALYAPLIASFPLLLIIDGNLSRIDGIILLLVSFLYFSWLINQEKRFAKIIYNGFKKPGNLAILLKQLAIFSAGVVLLLVSAEILVRSAVNLAGNLNLPLVVTGLILVAIGTSVPEITFGIRSINLGHKQMILGNAMGAVVVNSSLTLGITALIAPFTIDRLLPYLAGIIFTIVTALFFSIFAKTKREITKREGFFLLAIYALFVIVEFMIK